MKIWAKLEINFVNFHNHPVTTNAAIFYFCSWKINKGNKGSCFLENKRAFIPVGKSPLSSETDGGYGNNSVDVQGIREMSTHIENAYLKLLMIKHTLTHPNPLRDNYFVQGS